MLEAFASAFLAFAARAFAFSRLGLKGLRGQVRGYAYAKRAQEPDDAAAGASFAEGTNESIESATIHGCASPVRGGMRPPA
jgi:hypothetical protein